MRVLKMRQGETAPLVKVEDDRLVTTSSVPAEVLLGELTGEILTKEEMATRLEEYKVAGSYSRVWKIRLNLRMDTEPLQKPGSDFRWRSIVALSHSDLTKFCVTGWRSTLACQMQESKNGRWRASLALLSSPTGPWTRMRKSPSILDIS